MIGNEFGNVQDLVDIEDIREGTVVMKNGSIRQIVMVGGTNFSLKSGEEQDLLTQSYQNFLNGLNFPIQIVIHSRKMNIEHYVAKLDDRRDKEISGLLQDQISEYQAFIRSFIKDNAIMAKTFLVVVPYSPVVAPVNKSMFDKIPFFGKKTTPGEAAANEKKRIEADFAESFLQLQQRVAQVTRGLFALGLDAKLLNDEQLTELFYNFYNPETTEKESVPDHAKK